MTAGPLRRAVRVSAANLAPGDRVQPWNDRTAPVRTVESVRHLTGCVLVHWTDGAELCRDRAVYHRYGVRL